MAKEFRLEITFDAETKDCKVTGPLKEPDLCLLGLEMARRVVEQMKRKSIVMPMGGPMLRNLAPNLPTMKELLG